MMRASPKAKLFTSALALLLLVPVFGLFLQETSSLERFHNRTLIKWPGMGGLRDDPVAYFKQARAWLADRVFPIVQASMLQKRLLLYVLRTPPERRITMGRDGFIFVNGISEDSINGIFESVCVTAHSEPAISAFRKSLPGIASYAERRATPVDVVVVPTSTTLFGDYLPASVPERFRRACKARTDGESPLLALQESRKPLVVFPFLEMKAARDDPAFFPKGNWHPSGLSLKVVRDAYLARRNVKEPVPETLERTTSPSEILRTYGIDFELPVYRVHNGSVAENPSRNESLRRRVADLFASPWFTTHAFSNGGAVVPEVALLLSDSYGELAAPVFAGAFKELFQITTNDLKPARTTELIDRVSSVAHVDRVILLVQEGNTERIVEYSRWLAADDSVPRTGRDVGARDAAGEPRQRGAPNPPPR
jgi:hypothetical protein